MTDQAKETAVKAATEAVTAMELEGLTEEEKSAVTEAAADAIRNAEYDLSEPDMGDAMKHTDEALQGLSDAATSYSELQNTLAALPLAAGNSGDEDATGSMLAAIDTDELRTMIDQFSAGMHELSNGAAAAKDGADTLATSGAELAEGYGKITEGQAELLTGMKAFDKDGIGKLSELAGDDLTSMIRRLQALQKADLEYTNFSGLTDGTKGSVRFIIETEKIKAE